MLRVIGLDIYLACSKEVICFCESLFRHYKQLDLIWKRDKDYGHRITLVIEEKNDELLTAIAKSLVTVYYTYYLSKGLKKIIKNTYYFRDEGEIEKIIQHSHGLLYNDVDYRLKKTYKDKLVNLFKQIIQEKETVYFQSILHFQLGNFKTDLIHLVGLAIDEYKQEKRHQQFIHNIRSFLNRKEGKTRELHIVIGEKFTFYKSTGEVISQQELKKILQKEPLYLLGLHSSDYTLAPLIAMAPKSIIVYEKSPLHSATKTILNIFEERVTRKPLSQFPFTTYQGDL